MLASMNMIAVILLVIVTPLLWIVLMVYTLSSNSTSKSPSFTWSPALNL